MNLTVIWLLLAIAIIILILIVIIPKLIKSKATTLLNNMSGNSANIAHLNVQLFRSKLVLRNITIRSETEQETNSTLLDFPVIVIRFKWSLLLKKIIDLDIRVEKPCLYLPSLVDVTKAGKTPDEPSAPFDLKAVFERLIAFKVNLHFIDGSVLLRSHLNSLEYAINLDHINIEILDLSNRSELSDLSRIRCTAQLQDGNVDFSLSLRPLAPQPTLGLSIVLKSINLALFKELTKIYGNLDIDTGFVNLSSEMVIASSEFEGYIHLVVDELDLISAEDQGDPIISKILERVVGGVYHLMSQSKTNQLTLLIPFNGRLDDPTKSISDTIGHTIRKRFIREFIRSLTEVHSLWKGVEYAARGFLRRLAK